MTKKRSRRRRRNTGIVSIGVACGIARRHRIPYALNQLQGGNWINAIEVVGAASTTGANVSSGIDGAILGALRSAFGPVTLVRARGRDVSIFGR